MVVHWVGCVCSQSWHVRTCLSNSWHKLQVAAFAQLAVLGRGSDTCVYVIAIFTMCESTEQRIWIKFCFKNRKLKLKSSHVCRVGRCDSSDVPVVGVNQGSTRIWQSRVFRHWFTLRSCDWQRVYIIERGPKKKISWKGCGTGEDRQSTSCVVLSRYLPETEQNLDSRRLGCDSNQASLKQKRIALSPDQLVMLLVFSLYPANVENMVTS